MFHQDLHGVGPPVSGSSRFSDVWTSKTCFDKSVPTGPAWWQNAAVGNKRKKNYIRQSDLKSRGVWTR